MDMESRTIRWTQNKREFLSYVTVRGNERWKRQGSARKHNSLAEQVMFLADIFPSNFDATVGIFLHSRLHYTVFCELKNYKTVGTRAHALTRTRPNLTISQATVHTDGLRYLAYVPSHHVLPTLLRAYLVMAIKLRVILRPLYWYIPSLFRHKLGYFNYANLKEYINFRYSKICQTV
jgi:hypothetical protein